MVQVDKRSHLVLFKQNQRHHKPYTSELQKACKTDYLVNRHNMMGTVSMWYVSNNTWIYVHVYIKKLDKISTPIPTPIPESFNSNSNSNSGSFNSNSNSGKSLEYQLQLQLQLREFQLQLQLQLRQASWISTPTSTPEVSIPTPTPELELELNPTPTPTPELTPTLTSSGIIYLNFIQLPISSPYSPGASVTNAKSLLAESVAVIGWCFSISQSQPCFLLKAFR